MYTVSIPSYNYKIQHSVSCDLTVDIIVEKTHSLLQRYALSEIPQCIVKCFPSKLNLVDESRTGIFRQALFGAERGRLHRDRR